MMSRCHYIFGTFINYWSNSKELFQASNILNKCFDIKKKLF